MKVAFLTLGCKVNYYETERIKDGFLSAGAEVVPFEECADIYVVNTCTVTNIADRKSRKMLHRARKNNENGLVVACGCYVNSAKVDEVRAQGVDVCITNDMKKDAVQIILREYMERNPEAKEEDILDKVSQIKNSYKNTVGLGGETDENSGKHERTRAYIKVQDGCNQFCTYCIIPYVRGILRSRSYEDVVGEVTELAKDGYKEIVVTGIHVSSYGVDFDEYKEFLHKNRDEIKDGLEDGKKKEIYSPYDFIKLDGKPFLQLIRRISEIDGIERIRLGSLEPRIITESFVSELSKIKEVCPHFHLSLQSGDDETLKRMNRHYSTEDYLEGVRILKKYYEAPAITTDIIVGFAGETEEEFKNTLHFTEEVGFADVHVFKYSRRVGTVADKMKNQVDEKIKNDRSARLIEKTEALKKEYEEEFIGKRVKVLFEEIQEIEGVSCVVGYTDRYVRVAVKVESILEILSKKEEDFYDWSELLNFISKIYQNKMEEVFVEGYLKDGIMEGKIV